MNLFLPNIAHAESVNEFIAHVDNEIINPIIYLLFALALVYFLFGALQFILGQDNEEQKTTGKQHMIWGIIGIVIMMGVFGIMHLILATFDIRGINPEQGSVKLDPYTPPVQRQIPTQ